MAEAERRADFARRSFGFWKDALDDGDAPKDLLRFSDGTFALSCERANLPALKARGFFAEWRM